MDRQTPRSLSAYFLAETCRSEGVEQYVQSAEKRKQKTSKQESSTQQNYHSDLNKRFPDKQKTPLQEMLEGLL